MTPIRRVLIVSHSNFYRWDGQLFTYGHNAREIDIWADLFPEVLVASPCRDEPPSSECQPFQRSNVVVLPQLKRGGRSVLSKINLAVSIPYMTWQLARSMRKVDAIHVRCPSNLGLVGVMLAPLFSQHRMAKFTTQWNGYPGEPLSFRLQRWLLRSRWWGRAVTVYGIWPNEPSHVIPFFTAMMTKAEVNRSIEIAAQKQIELPLRLLYCGRLFYSKRVDVLLRAVELAARGGLEIEFVIAGDGPEASSLQRLAAELTVDDRVHFVGALPYEETIKWYEWAHCLALPSESEGWPKVVAEAMCHGLVCVASNCGQIPAMLTDRGILLKDGTPEEIAEVLRSVADNPDSYEPIRRAASMWSRKFTLEYLHDALAVVLRREWGVPVQYQTWD